MNHPRLSNSPSAAELIAAFHLGRRLNQLRWHRMQALVRFRPEEFIAATETLEQLKILFVQLLPTHDGGNLRTMVNEFQSQWRVHSIDDDLRAEWTDIDCDRVQYAPQPLGELATREAVSKFDKLVDNYAGKLESTLNEVLDTSPKLQELVVLGRKLDEGSHPAYLDALDLFRVDLMEGTYVLGSPLGTMEFPEFASHWHRIPHGTGQRRARWFVELCEVWHCNLQDLPAPIMSQGEFQKWNDMQFDRWLDRQIRLIENRLRKPTSTNVNSTIHAAPKAQTLFLDLIVDLEMRTISRPGYRGSVRLTNVPWSMFIIAYNAGKDGVSKEEMERDFDGQWDNHRPTKSNLNKSLRNLGVKIESNCWRLVDT